VLDEIVNENSFALPYKEFMLQAVPLPPTPARVRTLDWFMEIEVVNPRPNSCAALTGEEVPARLSVPEEGIVIC
jgi:hypothetical protein